MAIKFSPKDASKEAAKPAPAKPSKTVQPPVDDAEASSDETRTGDRPGDLFNSDAKPAGRKQKFRS
jgi:hypothetical protein